MSSEKPDYLICYDYETTSAMPLTTRGVQFAAIGGVVGNDFRVAQFETLFNEITDPEVEVDRGAAAVHGITPEMIVGKRLDKVVAAEFAAKVVELQQDYNVILAGHNCETFDWPIARRLSGHQMEGCMHIDTITCALRTLPTAPTHKLSYVDPNDPSIVGLIQHLKLAEGKAHDALGDIQMVWSLVQYFCAGLRMTPRQLAEWCAESHILEICHLKKHKGKPWKDVPGNYVWWICNNFDGASRDLRATIRHHFNKEFVKL